MKYQTLITRDANIMMGKPTIKGTRITVELILRKLSDGYSLEELLEMYPQINAMQVLAVLEYAAEVVAQEKVIER